MENEVEVIQTLPAVRERSSVLLVPVMDINTAMHRLKEFQAFCASYLEEGIDADFGTIPGTKKKTLLKPGADKLAEVYGLSDEYDIISQVENWESGLFDYKVKCILKSRRDDSLVGTGLGSCSSYESKYRWRDSQRKCPQCGAETIIKGKADFGGGWLCWTKKGGCGAKWKDGDESIEKQVIGRVENPDIVDTKNTVLKMAKKRAKIDAIIGVTRSSGIFTQDLEDTPATTTVKEPEKTTEVYTRSAASAVQPSADNKGPVEAAVQDGGQIAHGGHGNATSEAGGSVEASSASSAPTVKNPELIDQGQAVNFEVMFKDALHPSRRKEATKECHEWLATHGILDVHGKPTAKALRKHEFYELRELAMAHAAKLGPKE